MAASEEQFAIEAAAAYAQGGSGDQDNFFMGWTTIYDQIHNNITRNSDLPMALIHFLLTKHHQMSCIGTGTARRKDHGGCSALLPLLWNVHNAQSYTLNYLDVSNIYVLFGDMVDHTNGLMLITLYDTRHRVETNMTLHPDQLVHWVGGRQTLMEMMPAALDFCQTVKQKLIQPMLRFNDATLWRHFGVR